ncbi:hypothetical protein AB6D34_08135 [Pectobacterium brasiliense]|uniref:ATP-binding protein n=1 Tax=Pectobacterium brasiliense TaxID=180957 RepID=A0A3S1A093_9GAMM|nr:MULTISPECIES: hypothetical protein [Pectobacterium]GKW28018.1 hypothetical protein PEC331060_11960 [Pectobacterium carotovorum subsp. carotovorum]MBN3046749.1 hypothetical protein [Pectobacterium brasiliense]MBN3075117.1 hypothetical protein [Pectobacterium brasiliense]MBN3083756.1 hypothetical protein [Pectobacterium brasiliense]MBN3089296.1 hypothetical protein [Pectobacterium brasiliense]
MKLLEKRRTLAYARASYKRALRKFIFNYNKNRTTKRARNGRSLRLTRHKIIAPICLDLSKPQDNNLMIQFVTDIKNQAKKGTINKVAQIHLCFRESKFITPSGGLWLLANLEKLKIDTPYVKFTITRPPATRLNRGDNNRYPIVESVMSWIGIYEAIGLAKRELRELPTVNCWEAARGSQVASETVGMLLERITAKTGQNYQALYRPLVEAMSNSVEHAYRPDLYSLPQPDTKWWCFAAIMNNRLITLICDLGLGISKTLPKTQSTKFFNNIVEYIGHTLSTDSDFIRASLQLKKSATKLDYRGKGGPDLQSVIAKIPQSRLAIYSNKGVYTYTNRGKANPEKWFDNKLSIQGTIVECSIELPTQG